MKKNQNANTRYQDTAYKYLEIPYGNAKESVFLPLVDIGDNKLLLGTKKDHEELIHTLHEWSESFKALNEEDYQQYINIRLGIESLEHHGAHDGCHSLSLSGNSYELSPFESMTSSQFNKTLNKMTPLYSRKPDPESDTDNKVFGLDYLKNNIVEFTGLEKFEQREVLLNLANP